jgi:hypothetical protein
MRRVVLIVVTIACATGLGAVMGFQRESPSSRNNLQEKNHKPQDKETPQDNKNKTKKPKPFPARSPPPYNP